MKTTVFSPEGNQVSHHFAEQRKRAAVIMCHVSTARWNLITTPSVTTYPQKEVKKTCLLKRNWNENTIPVYRCKSETECGVLH